MRHGQGCRFGRRPRGPLRPRGAPIGGEDPPHSASAATIEYGAGTVVGEPKQMNSLAARYEAPATEPRGLRPV